MAGNPMSVWDDFSLRRCVKLALEPALGVASVSPLLPLLALELALGVALR